MASLAELKKRSKSNLESLVKKTESEKSGGTNNNDADERFWTPTRNKDGGGFAIIRFLPVAEVDSDKENALCWTKLYTHAFKNETNGRWYIETSLTTLGQSDAIGEFNRELWNSGNEDKKKQVQKQKRKLNYISNILVIKDSAKPECEGKVYLYKYGKKIFDKIAAVISPPEEFDEEPSDPFDFWTGRNFKLKIRTVDSYPNYDDSSFDNPSVISDKNGIEYSDEEIEKIYKKIYSLSEFTDPSNKKLFKSPAELEKRLNFVLGREEGSKPNTNSSEKPKNSDKPINKTSQKKEEVEEDISIEEGNDDIDIEAILGDI